ncbi:hypothetical protein HanRHA438_Chr00c85g0863151 [Helianthus annuus]|nr:hypothetical protein HanRHA438_Chr00c85g0863151 [Helianthus annuus]
MHISMQFKRVHPIDPQQSAHADIIKLEAPVSNKVSESSGIKRLQDLLLEENYEQNTHVAIVESSVLKKVSENSGTKRLQDLLMEDQSYSPSLRSATSDCADDGFEVFFIILFLIQHPLRSVSDQGLFFHAEELGGLTKL